jgi:hypothetical protein
MDEKHMTELISAALRNRDQVRELATKIKRENTELLIENQKLKFDHKFTEYKLECAMQEIAKLQSDKQDLEAVNTMMEKIVKKMTKTA